MAAEIPALLYGQFRYANRGFWRTPVAAFMTLVFPLSFVLILTAITGNPVIDEDTGMRLAQFTTPVFAVFGVCMASYVSLAFAMAYARASGVLKRLRGTPLPPAVHIAGRITSAMWISAIAIVALFGVGVTLYGVQIVWEKVPAIVLTFGVGIACFAALGLAVASLAPTPLAAQAFANATLILLSFISGIFGFADLPSWLDRFASLFPLAHFVEAVADGFNPYLEESALYPRHLAVMAVWGLFGAAIAWRSSRSEPGGGRTRKAAKPVRQPRPHRIPEPTLWRLVLGQTRYAAAQVRRDPLSLFFGVLFPVAFVVFFSLINGEDAQWGELPLAQYMAAAFSVYGVATTAYVNLPGAIAHQRAARVLKRLRGSPLPPWAYLAGRVLAALAIGLATVTLVFAVALVFLDVSLPVARWPISLLVFAVIICCFAALGLALVSLADAPQTVIAAALGTLLPLSFVSDIFIAAQDMPALLDAIGWAFPLRHAAAAAVAATSGGALDLVFWGHLGYVLAWGAAGAAAALRWFHWEPRTAGA